MERVGENAVAKVGSGVCRQQAGVAMAGRKEAGQWLRPARLPGLPVMDPGLQAGLVPGVCVVCRQCGLH